MQRRRSERSGDARDRRGRRARARANEEGWDRRLARIWGSLLILGFILPLGYTPAWRSSGGFVFVWDLLDDAPTMIVISSLLPLVLGVAALVVVGHRSPRLRGLVLLLGGLLVAILPVVVTGPLLFGPLGNAASLLALWLVALLAPPAIAGANRVARRAGADPLLRALAGLGGLALILILFLPIGPGGESILGALLDSDMRLGSVWPMLVWLLVVLLYAVVAVLYLVPAIPVQKTGPWLSMSARFALLGLPLAIFLLAFLGGEYDRTGFFPNLLVLAGGLLRLYGLLILTAVGVALVLERPEPARAPAEVERVFR